MTAALLDITTATVRRVVANAGVDAEVKVEPKSAGGVIHLHPPAGSPADCEAVCLEIEGSSIDMWVRRQLLEITDGGLEGGPFSQDHQRAIYEMARAVVTGTVTWTASSSARNGDLWKESICFMTSAGLLDCSTDFGTPLLGRSRKTSGRCRAYPS